MPVDKSMVDSILGTYRTMMADIEGKGIDNSASRQMKETLNKMESLALSLDDMMEFTTRLSTENLFVDFSTAYGKALAAGASQSSGGAGQDPDAYMMAQTLKAYEDALNTLKAEPAHAHLVPMVQKVVDMGKSGLSYPLFLKTCEEKGLFLGMDSPHAGPALEYEIHCHERAANKLEKERAEAYLKAFTALAQKAAFGYPDPVQWEITRNKIEWEYEPAIVKWKAIQDRWERLLDLVHDWIDAHAPSAMGDDRWIGDTPAITKENIQTTKDTNPGFLNVREEIFQEYFGLTFQDIFTHETYTHELASRLIIKSDEVIALIKEVYPYCHKGEAPPQALVDRAEDIMKNKIFTRVNRRTSEEMSPPTFVSWLQQQGKL